MKLMKLDVQERKMWVWFTTVLFLTAGLGFVAWRKSGSVDDAYDTYAIALVSLASGFIGLRVWEKIGLAKQGFVPTPQGSERATTGAKKPPPEDD